jgi:hypothetical protein
VIETLATIEPSALCDTIPAELLSDSASGAAAALSWLSTRPELTPTGADWLAAHGFPAAEPGKPVLLAGAIPYLDLLADEWLAADSLADQLVDALAVLQALGIEAGVSLERYKIDYATLPERYAGSKIFTLCPGCARSAREHGVAATSLVELLTERGGELSNGSARPLVAVTAGDAELAGLTEAVGLERVEIDPPPRIGRKLGITPDEHKQLEQRLVQASAKGAQVLLLACPAALAQHLIARREGSWRRSHARPVLIAEIAAAALRDPEVTA